MTRRTRHTHAIRTGVLERWEADSKWAGKARGFSGPTWCGESHGYNTMSSYQDGEDPHAYSRRMADCPKCSAAIGKARLAQLGGRVTMEKVDVPQGRYGSYYRTAWLIQIEGQPIAHAVMKNGWGNSWELKELLAEEDKAGNDFGRTISYEPSYSYPAKSDDVFQTVHFASKEAMACAAFRAREMGEYLFTVEERREQGRVERERREADDRQREERRKQYEAERDRKDGLRAERKALALEALEQLSRLPELSNLERAGLSAALDIITGRDVI